ncbi:MAG: peptidoglycan-binding domain-containing protein [Bacteroidota bacterium]
MKKILMLVAVICLPLIVYFQYATYRQYSPPAAFTHQVSDSVDLEYHDPAVVAAYYRKSVEMGTFGRNAWKESQVDVRTDQPATSPGRELVQAYQSMQAEVLELEARLRRSFRMKAKGMDNSAIKKWESPDVPSVAWASLLRDKPFLGPQDQGKNVFVLQQKLKVLGYDIPVDGYFAVQTEEAIKAFQEKSGIYPTGRADDLTLERLFEPS